MSHTVITTTTTTTRTSGDSVLNMGYTRTIPGMLKMGQMVSPAENITSNTEFTRDAFTPSHRDPLANVSFSNVRSPEDGQVHGLHQRINNVLYINESCKESITYFILMNHVNNQ